MTLRREILAERIYQVDSWNEKYPVGTPVEVTRDNGETFFTFTRDRADLVGDQPVVWVKGIAGCYALSRVRPIEGQMFSEPIDGEMFFQAVYDDPTMTPVQKIFWLYLSCKHLQSQLEAAR